MVSELKVPRRSPIQLFVEPNLASLQWLQVRQFIQNNIDLGFITQNILCPSNSRSLPFPGQVCMTTFVSNGPTIFFSNNNYLLRHSLSCQDSVHSVKRPTSVQSRVCLCRRSSLKIHVSGGSRQRIATSSYQSVEMLQLVAARWCCTKWFSNWKFPGGHPSNH